jgi:hypothetical protein
MVAIPVNQGLILLCARLPEMPVLSIIHIGKPSNQAAVRLEITANGRKIARRFQTAIPSREPA